MVKRQEKCRNPSCPLTYDVTGLHLNLGITDRLPSKLYSVIHEWANSAS